MVTKEVADLLGVPQSAIHSSIANGRLKQSPQKDASSRYVWTAEDIERLRQALSIDRRRKENRKQDKQ